MTAEPRKHATYVRHQPVAAFRIGKIEQGVTPGGNSWLVYPEGGTEPLEVSHPWFCYHNPGVGDYVILEADGEAYAARGVSQSEFESKYRKVEPNDG